MENDMSKLILKRFHCVRETNEIDSDSPYFLTFVGDISSDQTAIKLTRQGNWHNEVDEGEIWTANETVADGFNFTPSKSIILCGLVEEDDGLDVSSAEVVNIRNGLAARIKQHQASGANTVTNLIRNDLANLMRGLIQVSLLTSSGGRDEIVNVKPLKPNGQTGEQALVKLSGDGGYYRVRYGVA
jgi:hypothetical protein